VSVLVFSVLIIYHGWLVSAQKIATFQETIILEIPLGLLFGILPVMGFLMFVRTVQAMYKDLQEARSAKQN
jgi:TRAP-type C4-dicarboxylate transport system permease small subunit